jgi:hypothetical protein
VDIGLTVRTGPAALRERARAGRVDLRHHQELFVDPVRMKG